MHATAHGCPKAASQFFDDECPNKTNHPVANSISYVTNIVFSCDAAPTASGSQDPRRGAHFVQTCFEPTVNLPLLTCCRYEGEGNLSKGFFDHPCTCLHCC